MLIWTLILGTSLAGTADVTLNGVDVNSLRDTRFQQVDVYIDAEGNVHLSSDRYEVQQLQGRDAGGLQAPPKSLGTAPARVPPATPSAAAPVRAAPSGTPSSSTTPVRPSRLPAATTSVQAGTAQAKTGPVAPGSWWLATEDNASRGHEVRVYLNGALVQTLGSGQPQVIEDVSRHLRHGTNDVMIMSRSLNAGGGGFYVYLGKGKNQGGSVTLEQPDIQHGLGSSRRGDDVREYTLVVD